MFNIKILNNSIDVLMSFDINLLHHQDWLSVGLRHI